MSGGGSNTNKMMSSVKRRRQMLNVYNDDSIKEFQIS